MGGERFEVAESSVVKLHDDQEALRFEPGEHEARNAAELEALEYLTTVPAGDGPKMATKLRASTSRGKEE
jgi:hypothetical protein